MPRKDLSGQRFGRLTVLYLDEERTNNNKRKTSYWFCQCDCGNTKTICGTSLTRGLTQSCGCLQREKTSIDITGQRFGKLVALYKIESRYDKKGIAKTYWHCKCDCGNECDVLTANLRKGDTQSCGCKLKDYRQRAQNLVGQRFGKLIVLEKDEKISKEKGHTYWRCKCDCGRERSVYHTHLISGDTSSCGCLHSNGENIIEDMLKAANLTYSKEFVFNDLKGEGGGVLRFDFAIFENNSLKCLIEYNGIQHYQVIGFFGGEEQFQKQKRQDKRKMDYCKKNNIPLIIIPYTDDDKLSIDYIKERIE